MLWEVDIHPADGQPDRTAQQVAAAAAETGISHRLAIASARGFLLQGDLDQSQVQRLADELPIYGESMRAFLANLDSSTPADDTLTDVALDELSTNEAPIPRRAKAVQIS